MILPLYPRLRNSATAKKLITEGKAEGLAEGPKENPSY